MKKGRIKEVRESRRMIQEVLAAEIGITQQSLSRYEKNITHIKVDILIKIAQFFNVTTDYLLGISEEKRYLSSQVRMNKAFDECYEFLETFNMLDEEDKELLWMIMIQLKSRKNSKK